MEDESPQLNMDPETRQKIWKLPMEIGKRIIGNQNVIEDILTCIFAGGHILLESPPGLGKTELAKAIAETLNVDFKRIQCTPDLSPHDILGETYVEEKTQTQVFRKGPIHTNILLIDEINRAPPKTQAAFLEAMAEKKITVDGESHPLPEPFFVIATQNPIDYESTYPLPEAQQDRFLLKTYMDYLSEEDELKVLDQGGNNQPLEQLFNAKEILELQMEAQKIKVPKEIEKYILDIIKTTRERKEVYTGASTRAGVQFIKAIKAKALIKGRDYIITESDVIPLIIPVLRHRILMNPDSENFGYKSDDLLADIIKKTPQP
jgi:MoxR-like ATPase